MKVSNINQPSECEPSPGGLEPVAIIGMGLRFPGAIRSTQAYWDFMVAKREARREVPARRWDAYSALSPAHANAVRRTIRYGSYLDDVAGFDAEFFGIAPREAELMDPQQRITLEVAWETLEHAGIQPTTLEGSDTGVFMGVCSDDYGRRLLEDLPRLEAWMGIGSSMCGVANRVSYALDLRGPSVSVDTACSASLVAIHQACQSLRLGETGLALAGGVMLVTSPAFALVLEAAGALSPDGRSKAFDASADGYGRGEGCGMLALRRLSDARRDGDRVLGVIRGSAVCQDGRTNGIMAPSQEAQEHLVREACRHAGVSPSSLDYVEAHGTGTRLGDPIEVHALAAVVGVDRPAEQPCLIGSVKTNIGHLEAASGVASVIKLVLAMRNGQIPPTLSTTALNPDIAWDGSGLKVVDELSPWPQTDHPRRSGTGNYGYGGTIAHVIVEEAPADLRSSEQAPAMTTRDAGLRVFPLSAASTAGVHADAAALADWLSDNPSVPVESVGHTLARHRSALPVRAGVVAGDRSTLVDRLRQVAGGQRATGVSTGRVVRQANSPDAVWVFSGHGSQWVGMGRELLDTEPVVAQTMAELSQAYREELGFDPEYALRHDDLQQVDRVQAMIFAIQVALARVWERHGLRPAAVIGHSVGEIAAAVTAGLLDLPDAARLIGRRSRLLRRVAGVGAMAMVDLPFAEVAERLASSAYGAEVSAAIAASAKSTVVSGSVAEVERLIERWQTENLVVRRVNSDVAFHSAHMDPLVPDLVAGLAGLTPRPATVPVYSTALTDPRTDAPRDAAYWAANLANPVRFHDAVQAAVHDGHRVFLEVSAHPVVQHSITEILGAARVDDGVVAHTLRRGRPERETLLDNLATLHCHGVPVDWTVLQPDGRLVDLPARQWQHRRYWVEGDASAVGLQQHDVESHTLLGPHTAVQGTSPSMLWRTYLDFANRPYPGLHAVLGAEVIPAAVVLTTFFAGAEDASLRDVSLRVPIGVTTARELQVVRQDGVLHLSSRLTTQQDDQAWLTHAAAEIAGKRFDPYRVTLAALHEEYPHLLPPECVTDLLTAIGVVGIGFPWRVEEARRCPDGFLARVSSDPDATMGRNTWASLLDAALSVAPMVFPGDPLLRMPGRLREAAVDGPAPGTALIAVRLIEGSGESVEVDIEILTLDGTSVGRLTGVRFGAVERELVVDLGPDEDTTTDEPAWQSLTGPELRDHLVTAVRDIAAGEIRIVADELDPRRPLAELGVDSLMTVAIRLRLERRFATAVPSTLLWNRPTVAAIAEYLFEQLDTATPAPAPPPTPPAPAPVMG